MSEPVAKEKSKLWSQIVEDADPEPEDKTAYRFSNGRRFEAAGVYGEPERG